MYKIYNPRLDKYSTGGTIPNWSSCGKVWRTLNQLKAHFRTPGQNLYLCKTGNPHDIYIKDNCEVHEYSNVPTDTYLIKDFLK